MNVFDERTFAVTARSHHVGGAGLSLCREDGVPADLASQRTSIAVAAQGGWFRRMRRLVMPVLGILVILAPFAFLTALRLAVGREIFLWGLLTVAAVLVLAGLLTALAGQVRAQPARSTDESKDVPQVLLPLAACQADRVIPLRPRVGPAAAAATVPVIEEGTRPAA